MTTNDDGSGFPRYRLFDEAVTPKQNKRPTVPIYASLLSLVCYLFLEVQDDGDRKEDVGILFWPEYHPTTLYKRPDPISFDDLLDALKEDTTGYEFYESALSAMQSGEIEAHKDNYDPPSLDTNELPDNHNVYTVSFLFWVEKQGHKIPELIVEETTELLNFYVRHQQSQRAEKENFPEISGEEFAKLTSEPLWTFANAILHILGHQSEVSVSTTRDFISKRKITKKIIDYAKDAASIDDLILIGNFESDDELLLNTKVKPQEFIGWIEGLPLNLPIPRLVNFDPVLPTDTGEGEEPEEYTPPYIVFMLRAAKALEISPDKTTVKKQIEHWLKENWPSELGKPTDNIIKYMATLIRRPEEQKGGNRPNKKKPQA